MPRGVMELSPLHLSLSPSQIRKNLDRSRVKSEGLGGRGLGYAFPKVLQPKGEMGVATCSLFGQMGSHLLGPARRRDNLITLVQRTDHRTVTNFHNLDNSPRNHRETESDRGYIFYQTCFIGIELEIRLIYVNKEMEGFLHQSFWTVSCGYLHEINTSTRTTE